MPGFGSTDREKPFGARNGKPGEWYSYALLGEAGHCFGRYRNMDEHDSVVYFDRAPVEQFDDTGSRWVIKEGEIGIPLQQFKTFFHSTLEQAEKSVHLRNWYRQYLGEWVFVHGGVTAIGKACKVFANAFHMRPYISFLNKPTLITEGKERVVIFTQPTDIEVITEAALNEYLGAQKGRKTEKQKN